MTKITRAATAAAICAAVLLTGTACTGGDDGPKTSAKKSPPATPTAPAKPAVDVAEPNGDSVTEAPKIDRKTIASFANGQFGRNVPFKGGLRKGVLGIALNCTGKGTVKVDVPRRRRFLHREVRERQGRHHLQRDGDQHRRPGRVHPPHRHLRRTLVVLRRTVTHPPSGRTELAVRVSARTLGRSCPPYRLRKPLSGKWITVIELPPCTRHLSFPSCCG